MAQESTQKKITRVRPPRVHITYDVQIGNAIEMKEIPFVMGVVSDLSGNPEEKLPELKIRKFVDIDRDNFDDVLKGMKPRLTYRVDNKLANDESKLGVELRFESMEDFEPEKVVKHVEPLRKLLEARSRLSDLLSKMDGNDKLVDALDKVIKNTESMQKISQESGGGREDKEK